MGKPKYGCEECGRDYQSKAAADRHIRDKHNGNANRIPYAQLIADVGKGKHFEHIVGGLPSRVRRPDFGFIILEELCREAARLMAKTYFPEAFQDSEQVKLVEKKLLRDVTVLKRIVTTLSSTQTLGDFRYSTLEDITIDSIRDAERAVYLGKAILSDEMKSVQRRKESSKELSQSDMVKESFRDPDFRKTVRAILEGEKKEKT